MNVKNPNKLSAYFRQQKKNLLIVTVTGILYNIGMTAGPFFEGRMAQCLYDISGQRATWQDMLRLASIYVGTIGIIQLSRALKRFYVRRFANDTSRNMRHNLYNSIVHMNKKELEQQQMGAVMTKAISDVDVCVEGMRKFTTEVFDTGVVMVAYAMLLCIYDIRLTAISCIFIPIAYLIADRCKKLVTHYNESYKKCSGRLNQSTMDLVGNALTYRAFGQECQRAAIYEKDLTSYEQSAVKANLWESTLQPLYHVIAMGGAVFIFYLGGKNVIGTGWSSWDIGMFTTFFACFTRLSLKASKSAKLFNAVQKASVSWKRIQPMLREYEVSEENRSSEMTETLQFKHVSVSYPGHEDIVKDISWKAHKGQIIGVTGAVASGKSAVGKVLIGEADYSGSIEINGNELKSMPEEACRGLVSYMGHEPELVSTSIAENIMLSEEKEGKSQQLLECLERVSFAQEVAQMPEGIWTVIGSGGMRLSGGQQERLALARCLWHQRNIQVLDDPFSAVDKQTQQLMFRKLRENSTKQITLLISHRLDMFPELDGILYLEDGRAFYGKHEELMRSRPGYARLFRFQGTQRVRGGEEHA